MEIVKIALAAWALTWSLSMWVKTYPFRVWLGIQFEIDSTGEPIDRVDDGGFGAWINCPMCALIMSLVPVWILWYTVPVAVEVLATLGLGLLVIRWFEGARTKARWWE